MSTFSTAHVPRSGATSHFRTSTQSAVELATLVPCLLRNSGEAERCCSEASLANEMPIARLEKELTLRNSPGQCRLPRINTVRASFRLRAHFDQRQHVSCTAAREHAIDHSGIVRVATSCLDGVATRQAKRLHMISNSISQLVRPADRLGKIESCKWLLSVDYFSLQPGFSGNARILKVWMRRHVILPEYLRLFFRIAVSAGRDEVERKY